MKKKNIKVVLVFESLKFQDAFQIHSKQDIVQKCVFVITVMNLQVPLTAGNCFTHYVTFRSSSGTPLHNTFPRARTIRSQCPSLAQKLISVTVQQKLRGHLSPSHHQIMIRHIALNRRGVHLNSSNRQKTTNNSSVFPCQICLNIGCHLICISFSLWAIVFIRDCTMQGTKGN